MKEEEIITHRTYAKENRLILRRDYRDFLDYDDVLQDESGTDVCLYYRGGYDYVSVFMSKRDSRSASYSSRLKIAYMTAINITYLNTDKSVDVISKYLDLMCTYTLDSGDFKVNRDKLLTVIEKTLEGVIQPNRRTSKYFWLKPIDISEKRKIIGLNISKTVNIRNVGKIEAAIESIIERDDETFITIDEIRNEIGISEISSSTIRRHINDELKDRISKHNISIHSTSSFKMYEKFCNVHNIVGAINAIAHMNESISKMTVARYASVHRNTVNNLWDEEDVQEALANYNKIVS